MNVVNLNGLIHVVFNSIILDPNYSYYDLHFSIIYVLQDTCIRYYDLIIEDQLLLNINRTISASINIH